jgi:hypothetical protein
VIAPVTGHDTDAVLRLPISALIGVNDVTRADPA